MDKVIKNSMDEESKESAVDEKLKMKDQHDKKLESIAGFIRNIDDALKALRPGQGDWKEKFPDTDKKVKEIFEAYPVLLTKKAHVKTGVAAMARSVNVAARAEAYIAYLGK